jgi:hypothetical protein
MNGYNLYICMYKSIPFIKKYKKQITIHGWVNPTGITTRVLISGKLWVEYTRTQKPDIKSHICVYKMITTKCH